MAYIVCNGVKRTFNFSHELGKYRLMRNGGVYTEKDIKSLRELLKCGNIPPCQKSYLERELSLMKYPRKLPRRLSEVTSMDEYKALEEKADPITKKVSVKIKDVVMPPEEKGKFGGLLVLIGCLLVLWYFLFANIRRT